MNKIYIPENYKPVLDAYDTQRAIAYIKETFQQEFSKALNLKRVSAPLFVTESYRPERQPERRASGLSAFDIPRRRASDAAGGAFPGKVEAPCPQALRISPLDNGLYTDMNAIRRDEALDNIHSIYVDQWDWEKVITRENRNLDFLKLIGPRHRGRHLRHQRPLCASASPAAQPS